MMNKKKLSALLLTGSMLMSMSMPTFAEGTTDVPTIGTSTDNTDVKASITKNFEFSEGITVPTATFNFTVTKNTADAPDATINPISYSSNDNKGTLNNGKYTISKDSAISFGTFPHAGVYEYTVAETKGSDSISKGTVTYSTETYKLRVYAANKNDGSLYIKTITAEKGDQKQEKILFTNTYTKNSSLSIEKTIDGNLADKTKKFAFTIQFTKSATASNDVDKYIGYIGKEPVECIIGEETTFYLGHGEKLLFDNLPAGTRYVVTEKGVEDGYTPEVTVFENNVESSVKQGKDEVDLKSADEGESNLVGENTNKVTFVNKYRDVAITGMIINNLPFIMLISIAGLAFVALAVIKRQRALKL